MESNSQAISIDVYYQVDPTASSHAKFTWPWSDWLGALGTPLRFLSECKSELGRHRQSAICSTTTVK